MAQVSFKVEVADEKTALALAQFLKRVTYATCERHADPTHHNEPQEMLDGLTAVQRGLSAVGYQPR